MKVNVIVWQLCTYAGFIAGFFITPKFPDLLCNIQKPNIVINLELLLIGVICRASN